MEKNSIYQDIAKRTNGDIYVGVVGPVRTGKSTFIKKFMETLVIPNINSKFQKERAEMCIRDSYNILLQIHLLPPCVSQNTIKRKQLKQ